MAGKLPGKVAVVTGAGQGLGFGMAHAFADEGAKVVITGRVAEKLETKAAILREKGAEVICVPGDVGKRSDVKEIVAQTLAAFGKIDILVNNAQSMVKERPLHELEDRHLEASIQSGLFGTIYCMQEAYPALKAQGGSIINFGSVMGVTGTIGCGSYAAAKEGIRGVSRVAARDWGIDGIRVNVICPSSSSEALVRYFEAFPENCRSTRKIFRSGDLPTRIRTLANWRFFLQETTAFLPARRCSVTAAT